MQAQQAPMIFTEAERQAGDRLLKLALETDRVEGYTEPHAVMIARLTEAIGRELGLHGVDLSALKFAALAHDIGERGMKRNYLLSPNALTWEERLDLWRHPILGEQAAAEIRLSRQTQLLVRWHHEWWNGQGYPDGLSGEAIPVGARILRAVDSYCALISGRPFRQAYELVEAEQHIADMAGIEFDPIVAKLLLMLVAEERRQREAELEFQRQHQAAIWNVPAPFEQQPADSWNVPPSFEQPIVSVPEEELQANSNPAFAPTLLELDEQPAGSVSEEESRPNSLPAFQPTLPEPIDQPKVSVPEQESQPDSILAFETPLPKEELTEQKPVLTGTTYEAAAYESVLTFAEAEPEPVSDQPVPAEVSTEAPTAEILPPDQMPTQEFPRVELPPKSDQQPEQIQNPEAEPETKAENSETVPKIQH